MTTPNKEQPQVSESIEELAFIKYPSRSFDHIGKIKRGAFIAGYTAATKDHVKVSEVEALFRNSLTTTVGERENFITQLRNLTNKER